MSSHKSRPTRAASLANMQALIAGTEKHFGAQALTIGKTAYTSATLAQTLQAHADKIAALAAAHVAVKDAFAALAASEVQTAPLLRNYKQYLQAVFGGAPAELADFGLQPPKARTPLTSEQRALAAAKLRATRAARGTKGSRQRLAIKGDVTGVVIAPVVVLAAAAAPVAAAPPPPPETHPG